jgi:hypothetical protein
MLPNTMTTNPAVATTSASSVPDEARWWPDRETASSSNIRLARTQPTTPPATWAATDRTASRVVTRPSTRSTAVTTGLKLAETGWSARINATRAAPVTRLFSNS